jgi:predicted phosphodiesterase
MRIAVISDIHGNRFALDVALNDIRAKSVERIVCLGDTVQGGAQPAETVEKLRELKCPVVMGNADAWLLSENADTAEPTTAEQHEVRAWTLSKLSSSDLRFLNIYRPTVEMALGNDERLLCFHGSPKSYDDVLLPGTPQDTWDRLLGPFAPAIMTGGHTHTQQVRRVGDGFFFNPGSIGVAYNGLLPEDRFHTDAWAEYAILSQDRGRLGVEFRRIPYDVERLIRIIRRSGRPHADRMIDAYRQSAR